MLASHFNVVSRHPVKVSLFSVWICILLVSELYLFTTEYGGFLLLGIVGAIFANATGAGGGVVFVPFFNQLGFASETIVATSFAIQCCGMTAGAVTWFRYATAIESPQHKDHNKALHWQALGKGLAISIPFSLLGISVAQYLLYDYTAFVQEGLHLYFSVFSIVLAFAIYGSIPAMRASSHRSDLSNIDIVSMILIAFCGGIITAWLSVGVGELIAVYLILRGFNIGFAIALAVILSAFTVQGAMIYHLFISQAVYWHVVVFAGAGAIIGGALAKHIVLSFSPLKLKVFFGTWVLFMGLAGLPIL